MWSSISQSSCTGLLQTFTVLRRIEVYGSLVCEESKIAVPSVWSSISPSSCTGLLQTFLSPWRSKDVAASRVLSRLGSMIPTVVSSDAALKLHALVIRSVSLRWKNSAHFVLSGGSGGRVVG